MPVASALADPWAFEATIYADRSAGDTDEEYGSVRDLQPRFGGGITASRSFAIEKDKAFGLALGIDSERYPQTSKANRWIFHADPDLTIKLNQGILREISFFASLAHATDDDDWVYSRIRAGSAIRLQFVPRSNILLRSRLGYRQQNEAHTFDGYDQSELLLDLTYNKWSADSVNHFTGMAYYERRNAESNQYSYDEFGARLIGRHELKEKVDLVGRANAFTRDYDDDLREDQRIRGTVGIDWEFAEQATLGTFAGYERNHSTVDAKDYGGPVFGIQLTKKF